jgi:hypothetical protein
MKQHSNWANQKCRTHLLLELHMAFRTCPHGLGPLRLAVFEYELHLFLAPFLPQGGLSPSEPLDASTSDLPCPGDKEMRKARALGVGDVVTVAVMSVMASARRSRNRQGELGGGAAGG